jgi:hypothetical protein
LKGAVRERIFGARESKISLTEYQLFRFAEDIVGPYLLASSFPPGEGILITVLDPFNSGRTPVAP